MHIRVVYEPLGLLGGEGVREEPGEQIRMVLAVDVRGGKDQGELHPVLEGRQLGGDRPLDVRCSCYPAVWQRRVKCSQLERAAAPPNIGMQRTRAIALPSCRVELALAADAGRSAAFVSTR